MEGRRLGGVTLECLAPPSEPLTPCALPAANSPAFSVDSCTALISDLLEQWVVLLSGPGGRRVAAMAIAPPGPGSRGGGSSRREPTPKGGGRQAPQMKKKIGAAAAVPHAASPRPVVAAIRRTTGRDAGPGAAAESLERQLVRALQARRIRVPRLFRARWLHKPCRPQVGLPVFGGTLAERRSAWTGAPEENSHRL